MSTEKFFSANIIALFRRVYQWSQKSKLSQKLVAIFFLMALGAGVATYYALIKQKSDLILMILNFDIIILILLISFIIRRVIKLWRQSRSGRAGSKLHLKLALIFAALTVIPTIFISISSTLLFKEGIQSWFNHSVKTALNESSVVAEAYLEEHKKTIRSNVLALAMKFAEKFERYAFDQDYFSQELDKECFMMSLNESIIFNLNHHIYAKTRLSFSLEFESLSGLDMQRAREDVIIQTSDSGDRVRAFTLIPGTDAYIIAGRYLDTNVLKRIKDTKNAVSEYNQLELLQKNLEVKLALTFIIVALILLLTAVWMGLLFAENMAYPLSQLIYAADSVRQGNYRVQVLEKSSQDEIAILSRAFNRMISEISTQQKQLLEANQQIDQRRQFIEDVLEGVTAGVFELSQEGQIRLFNRSAVNLLSLDQSAIINQNISQVVPEMMPHLSQAFESKNRFYQAELSISRLGILKTLLVRVVVETTVRGVWGYIITFDDITALLSAQRKATWSDVARRIAHEIKNPLTPIRLSAERLRRKYLKQIHTDPENFETCVNTIVRQVDQMERLVSEFSSFARMPNPRMAQENIIELCQQAIDLQKLAHPTIEFSIVSAYQSLKISCDASQIGQALTNLLKNAIDSIISLENKHPDPLYKGRITISINYVDMHSNLNNKDSASLPPHTSQLPPSTTKRLSVIIEDNGEGFPENTAQLLDPYVTLREKGTGLGLAIVKKIVEDHLGEVSLGNISSGGAYVKMIFPGQIVEK